MTPRVAPALLLALFLVACAADVTREDWQRMSADQKSLYVKSLIGAEVARDRKQQGSSDSGLRALTPQQIVTAIDDAYARGDARPPEEIFSTLAARPDSPQPPRPASP